MSNVILYEFIRRRNFQVYFEYAKKSGADDRTATRIANELTVEDIREQMRRYREHDWKRLPDGR